MSDFAQQVRAGVQALQAGRLVAFPTETVYGLGADATSAAAVHLLYSVKGRPPEHPVIVHIADAAAIDDWARDVPAFARALAAAFWPGPMTLILPRSAAAADFITGGQDNVGLRVPRNDLALALLRGFREVGGLGVAAPSANRFGSVSATTAQAVRDEFADVWTGADVIIEDAQSEIGVESTIVDCTGVAPRVLRPGAVTAAMIEAVVGLVPAGARPPGADPVAGARASAAAITSDIRVSGSLARHYSPRAQVIIGGTPRAGDGFIALATVATPTVTDATGEAGGESGSESGGVVIRLAAPQTNSEFAHVLYAALREADARNLARVVVIPPEGDDIAAAIRDRLTRAAGPG
jgi:L-threonylcarbamoyladenylate synthase